MKRMVWMLAGLVVGAGGAGVAQAEPLTITVEADGGDGVGKDALGNHYDGLQQAVEAAAMGGVVQLMPGTYVVRLTMPAGQVHLVGAGPGEVRLSAAPCTFEALPQADGEEVPLCSVVVANQGGHHSFEGLTLDGGLGTSGYALLFDAGGVKVGTYPAHYKDLGGAVACLRTQLSFDHVVIQGGWAESGGGIFTDNCRVDADHLLVTGNEAAWIGGGALFHESETTLRHTTLSGNVADNSGGGLAAEKGALTVYNSEVGGNLAYDRYAHGGGMDVGLGTRLHIVNTTVHDNEAADGGGLYLYGDSARLLIESSIFASNRGLTSGPNLWVEDMAHTAVMWSLFWEPKAADAGIDGRVNLTVKNVVADPQFEVPPGDGAQLVAPTLRPSSPAVNTGHPGEAWQDADGSRNDMGMFGGPDGGP